MYVPKSVAMDIGWSRLTWTYAFEDNIEKEQETNPKDTWEAWSGMFCVVLLDWVDSSSWMLSWSADLIKQESLMHHDSNSYFLEYFV